MRLHEELVALCMPRKMSSDDESSEKSAKKPKLRTASDVISRLLWDDSLPESKFVVGYLDRFKGIVEKPFTSLDWSDPSTVDNNTLALPKHRIEYFKYKNAKVWDKKLRLDLIFGSSSDPISIHDFMAEVDENELLFFCEDRNACFYDVSDYMKVSADSDQRSNFFVAARITDTKIRENLYKVAAHIIHTDSTLSDCCMDKSEYHLTLATMKLDTPEEINDAVVALSDLQMQKVPTPTINLSCVDNFRQRVLYACISENEELLELRKMIISILAEWKVNLMDKFVYVPHVTILKISRPAARLRNSNVIAQSLYLNYEDTYFGSQIIDKLYLCEMGEARRDDGFYNCAVEIELT